MSRGCRKECERPVRSLPLSRRPRDCSAGLTSLQETPHNQPPHVLLLHVPHELRVQASRSTSERFPFYVVSPLPVDGAVAGAGSTRPRPHRRALPSTSPMKASLKQRTPSGHKVDMACCYETRPTTRHSCPDTRPTHHTLHCHDQPHRRFRPMVPHRRDVGKNHDSGSLVASSVLELRKTDVQGVPPADLATTGWWDRGAPANTDRTSSHTRENVWTTKRQRGVKALS